MMEFITVLIFLLVVILIVSIKIVPQASEFVIELLGKYKTTWGAGIHFKIPFIEKIAKRSVSK